MSYETTSNIANVIQTDFRLVAAGAGKSADDLYANIDTHDSHHSTSHNKGVSSAAALLMRHDTLL